MTHDTLCPQAWRFRDDGFVVEVCVANHDCQCSLIAKVRADERDKTLDDAINLLEEMNCKRLWWDDMLTG